MKISTWHTVVLLCSLSNTPIVVVEAWCVRDTSRLLHCSNIRTITTTTRSNNNYHRVRTILRQQQNPQQQQTRVSPEKTILEDGSGHINRDLAERIWNWEQERRERENLPKINYSIRAGLRLIESIVDDVLSLRARNNDQTLLYYSDLVQDGLTALLDAMIQYRKEKEEEEEDTEDTADDFEVYARDFIRNRLEESFQEDSQPIHLPESVRAIVQETKRLMKTTLEDGTQPTLRQVAKQMKIPAERLQEFLRLSRSGTVSMESTVEVSNSIDDWKPTYRDQDEWELRRGYLLDDGHAVRRDELVQDYVDESMQLEGDDEAWIQQEENAGPLQDLIPDMEEPSPDDSVLETLIRNDLSDFLTSTLDEQELQVIRSVFGLESGKPASMRKTAAAMNISAEQVSRLLGKALKKLRREYINRYLEPYSDDEETEHDMFTSDSV